jgi:membrane-associated phospholipid phosphatase
MTIPQTTAMTNAPGDPASLPAVAAPVYAARRSTWWRAPAWWVVAFAVACAWDRALWLAATRGGKPVLERLEGYVGWTGLSAVFHEGTHAIGELLVALAYDAAYFFGRIYLWLALALFFMFRDWAGTDGHKVREGIRRGVFVALVPGVAGISAEGLKLLSRRERPEELDGYYAFKARPAFVPMSGEFWDTTHLGLASSHAAVAFGGALAAGLLLPRWRVPLFVLAGLCAASRVAVGAHFLSDVVAGAALAFAAFKLFYAWDARNNGGRPLTA